MGAVVACDRGMDIALTLGVHLELGYVPGALPSLGALFRCNRTEIAINPLCEVRSKPEFDELEQRMRSVVGALRPLRRPFLHRYHDLSTVEVWNIGDQDRPSAAAGGWRSPTMAKGRALPTPATVDLTFETPVDLSMVDRPAHEVGFDYSSQPAPVTASAGTSPARLRIASGGSALAETEARTVLGDLAVAILCGGVMPHRRREVLDPGGLRDKEVPS